MLDIETWLNLIHHKVTAGSAFTWDCFGKNARAMGYFDQFSEVSIDIVFDTETKVVYMLEAIHPKNRKAYRYFNPEFRKAYFDEEKKRNVTEFYAWDDVKWTELEVLTDWYEKADAIFHGRDYDERIQVEMDLEDDVLLNLAKEAHKRDITINQMIEITLRRAIEMVERNKPQQ